MILDHLDNAPLYFGVGDRIATALKYLQATDLARLPTGRNEIDGERIFALVFEYETKHQHTTFWEAHRQYIDIQYVHEGVELMGYAPLSLMQAGPYDKEKDFLRADGEGEFFQLRAGFFAILGPQDAHMPGIVLSEPAPVRKIIIKVAVGQD